MLILFFVSTDCERVCQNVARFSSPQVGQRWVADDVVLQDTPKQTHQGIPPRGFQSGLRFGWNPEVRTRISVFDLNSVRCHTWQITHSFMSSLLILPLLLWMTVNDYNKSSFLTILEFKSIYVLLWLLVVLNFNSITHSQINLFLSSILQSIIDYNYFWRLPCFYKLWLNNLVALPYEVHSPIS